MTSEDTPLQDTEENDATTKGVEADAAIEVEELNEEPADILEQAVSEEKVVEVKDSSPVDELKESDNQNEIVDSQDNLVEIVTDDKGIESEDMIVTAQPAEIKEDVGENSEINTPQTEDFLESPVQSKIAEVPEANAPEPTASLATELPEVVDVKPEEIPAQEEPEKTDLIPENPTPVEEQEDMVTEEENNNQIDKNPINVQELQTEKDKTLEKILAMMETLTAAASMPPPPSQPPEVHHHQRVLPEMSPFTVSTDTMSSIPTSLDCLRAESCPDLSPIMSSQQSLASQGGSQRDIGKEVEFALENIMEMKSTMSKMMEILAAKNELPPVPELVSEPPTPTTESVATEEYVDAITSPETLTSPVPDEDMIDQALDSIIEDCKMIDEVVVNVEQVKLQPPPPVLPIVSPAKKTSVLPGVSEDHLLPVHEQRRVFEREAMKSLFEDYSKKPTRRSLTTPPKEVVRRGSLNDPVTTTKPKVSCLTERELTPDGTELIEDVLIIKDETKVQNVLPQDPLEVVDKKFEGNFDEIQESQMLVALLNEPPLITPKYDTKIVTETLHVDVKSLREKFSTSESESQTPLGDNSSSTLPLPNGHDDHAMFTIDTISSADTGAEPENDDIEIGTSDALEDAAVKEEEEEVAPTEDLVGEEESSPMSESEIDGHSTNPEPSNTRENQSPTPLARSPSITDLDSIPNIKCSLCRHHPFCGSQALSNQHSELEISHASSEKEVEESCSAIVVEPELETPPTKTDVLKDDIEEPYESKETVTELENVQDVAGGIEVVEDTKEDPEIDEEVTPDPEIPEEEVISESTDKEVEEVEVCEATKEPIDEDTYTKDDLATMESAMQTDDLDKPQDLTRSVSESNLKRVLKFSVSMDNLDTSDVLTISFEGDIVNIQSSSKVLAKSSIDISQNENSTVLSLRSNSTKDLVTVLDSPADDTDDSYEALEKPESDDPAASSDEVEASSVDTVIEATKDGAPPKLPPQKLYYFEEEAQTEVEIEGTLAEDDAIEGTEDDIGDALDEAMEESEPEVLSASGSHENILEDTAEEVNHANFEPMELDEDGDHEEDFDAEGFAYRSKIARHHRPLMSPRPRKLSQPEVGVQEQVPPGKDISSLSTYLKKIFK